MFSPEKLYRKYIKDDYDILVAYLEGSCTRIISGCPDKNKVKITWRHFAENEKEFLQAYRSMDEAKKMMYRFKYGNRRTYADFFADEAQKQYGDWITGKSVEAVVPVPMYRKKEKQRGYNQADVFAKKLADALGLAYEPAAVQRIVDTKPQKELGDEERKNNLKNAFHVEKFIVKYKYILLVDDIYTTGSTAEAVARQLLAAGVEKVFFLSVCIGNGY